MDGYWLKCREKKGMENPQEVVLNNGRPATNGDCSACGTKMYRIGKAAQSLAVAEPRGGLRVPAVSRFREPQCVRSAAAPNDRAFRVRLDIIPSL